MAVQTGSYPLAFLQLQPFSSARWIICSKASLKVAAFQDDILITGATEELHIHHFSEVLRRLHSDGFKLKRDKCEFMLPEVKYLGYRITIDGVQPTKEKVEAVQNVPIPQNASELKSFLGINSANHSPVTIQQPSAERSHLQAQISAQLHAQKRERHAAVCRASGSLQPLSCDVSEVGLGAVLARRLRNLMALNKMEF